MRRWRLYCVTEGIHKYVEQDAAPTVCPTNPAHTIKLNSITLVETDVTDVVNLNVSGDEEVLGTETVHQQQISESSLTITDDLIVHRDSTLGDDASDRHIRSGDEDWYGSELRGWKLLEYGQAKWSLDSETGKGRLVALEFTPVANTVPDNNSLFVDSADNVLKFKDSGGGLHSLI